MDADADFSLEQSEAGQTALLTGDWTATRVDSHEPAAHKASEPAAAAASK